MSGTSTHRSGVRGQNITNERVLEALWSVDVCWFFTNKRSIVGPVRNVDVGGFFPFFP